MHRRIPAVNLGEIPVEVQGGIPRGCPVKILVSRVPYGIPGEILGCISGGIPRVNPGYCLRFPGLLKTVIRMYRRTCLMMKECNNNSFVVENSICAQIITLKALFELCLGWTTNFALNETAPTPMHPTVFPRKSKNRPLNGY